MAELTWVGHSHTERGKLIKFMVTDPDKNAPALRDVALDVTSNKYSSLQIAKNFSANEYPAVAEIKIFKQELQKKFRDYLDNLLAVSFKVSITEEQISILYGDNPIYAKGAAKTSDFVERVGSTAVDEREAGIDRRMYKRQQEELAIISPDQYVKNRNLDLDRIDRLSMDTFRSSFNTYYYNYKFTAEDAKKKAIEDKNEHFKRLMEGHKAIYDVEDYNKAEKRIVKSS